MTCDVCGHTDFRRDKVNRTFTVGDKPIVVKGIPAEVCVHCGEPSFTAQVAEQLRRLVHEPHKPQRVIEAEVLEFHAA